MRSIRRRGRRTMTLQLTSLLDMFTIILVFMLESFQADDENFVLHAGLELPGSTARNPFKTAVNIAISTDAVFIDGDRVYELGDDMLPDGTDLEAGRIDAVTEAVEQAWAELEATGEQGEEGLVASLQADQTLPYETIDLVARSAGWAGCYRFRLVVEKE